MKETEYQKITDRCAAIITSAAVGTGKAADGLAQSPVRFLSLLPEEERIFLLVFLEAYIAAETENAEGFQLDLVLAINEFLMERSALSVRMLNLWVKDADLQSMRDAGTWIEKRYSTALGYLRESMQFDGDNAAAGIVQLRNWCEETCREIIADRKFLPPRLSKYSEVYRNLAFREDPLQYLQGVREEERRRILLIPAAILLQGKGREIPSLFAGGRRELIETTLLFNRFCKYPEDTEIQTRLLMAFFRMDASDFASEKTRRAFFNERLRFAAYAWNSDYKRCRRQFLQLFDQVEDLYVQFPEDLEEPSPEHLQLDEAILNIPAFLTDPVDFLRTQTKEQQAVHFLLMLSAMQYVPEEAVLRARILGEAIFTMDADALERAGRIIGVPAEDDTGFTRLLGSYLLQTASLWRWNKQDCRKKVKRNWESYEEKFAKTYSGREIPPEFAEVDALLRSREFAEDPVFAVRLLREDTLIDCLGLCGLVRGFTPETAAENALAASLWLRDPRNEGAVSTLVRINRLEDRGRQLQEQISTKLLTEPALLWRYNICGAADEAVDHYEEMKAAMEELRRRIGEDYEEEPEDLERFSQDPAYLEDPCSYLLNMTELSSRRLLLYAGRMKGLSPKAAIGVANLFSGMLHCPNAGTRDRLDALFSTNCLDDEERRELIGAYLLQDDLPEQGTGKAPWTAYRRMFDRQLLWEQKNHWELNPVNVRKLYDYCLRTDPAVVVGEEAMQQKISFDSARLFGDRVITILRCMTGQLEVVHAACRGGGEVRFSITELALAASAEGEPRVWTSDPEDVRKLLFMAQKAELLPPSGFESLGEETAEYLDLHAGVNLHAEPVLYRAG